VLSSVRVGPQYHYQQSEPDPPDPDGRIGIALSGGGVRAACLGLGALQRSEDLGVFRRSSYLSAVSGGSYIATAFVASRAGSTREGPLPWQKGSNEEAHLRRNLRYLAEDWPDQCLALMSYLFRTAIHLLQFAAVLVLVGSSLGLLYRSTGWLTTDGQLLTAGDQLLRYSLVVALFVVGAGIDGRAGKSRTEPLMGRMYLARRHLRRWLMALVAILVVPDVIAFGTNVFNARKVDVAAARGPALGVVAVAMVAGAIVLRTQGFFPKSRLLRLAGMTLRAVFSLLVLTIFVLPPLMLISQQTSQREWIAALSLLGSCVFLVLCGTFVHANWTSLHSTYARRLARAYIVRDTAHEPMPEGAASWRRTTAPPQRLDSVHLDDLRHSDVPDLILCAAANIGDGESAQGEGCASFVFSRDFCGLPTRDLNFKDVAATRNCAELVAASGAAIAPNMGRLTRKSARALLALLNLRLGMWIQVPRSVKSDGTGMDALLRRVANRLPPFIVHGWREPGPLWTWREAFGDVSQEYEALFISDGGHWDNSGVIELMRRRCQTIFAVDAAVDDKRLSNLLRAISLARTELGVEILTDSALLQSREPILRLRFAYPDQDPGAPKNQLIVMRTHIDAAMPADLAALSLSSGAGSGTGIFPRHVTMNQFLLARDVDAYITLGRWLFDQGYLEADLHPDREGHAETGVRTRAVATTPTARG
jgi:hypothetical protein